MKLRSGLTYHFNNKKLDIITTPDNKTKSINQIPKKKKKKILIIKRKVKPIITIDKNLTCSICSKLFVKDDLICSCSINNINKHAFHKNCLKEWIKYCHPCQKKCPYCLTDIKKRLVYVKIQ